MGIFAGISDVSVKQESRFPEPGTLIVEITGVRQGRTRESDKPYFVVEMVVHQSDTDGFDPGDRVVWMTQLHQWKHYFLEDVKMFVSSAMEASPDDVTEEVVEAVAGVQQPLVGIGLRLRTWQETNKKSGKTFKKSSFKRVDLAAVGTIALRPPQSTDHFGPAADEEGGSGVVAINKSEIPDFRGERMTDSQVEAEFTKRIRQATADVGDGDNMY